ncbi:UDP-N-acetylmuramate dehydrogenase [Pontibacter sp. G13]|uniref:UDP-N-acetylmuramate dehydrogenase n=1 Tax=Pontibacter sp. G13 TaxID=3074898 RepID=UPI002889B7D4|nr:UDP-N-acetylmuramate dehydrogenase [Pontibacter sp. G13]WNJ20709.1 UDP-N-acetylmuramate dehydrogenase [Pontibacter sp. G13]
MPHIETDFSLKPYNTFGLAVNAKWFLSIESEEDMRNFLIDNGPHGREILILGGGSNVLFTQDFEGIVLHNRIQGREVIRETDDHVWVKLGAGENWHQSVRYTIDQGWGGIENLSLIPGSVGAAPIQNIGAYGVEVKDVFDHLEAIHLDTGVIHSFDRAACEFGYRDSIFKRDAKGSFMITRVVLKLAKQPVLNTSYGAISQELAKRSDAPTIRSVSEVVCEIRSSKLPDPAQIGNAGSFFKNPVVSQELFQAIQQKHPQAPHYPQSDGQIKVPAGWLIQTAGFKGMNRGTYGVHDRQALVLVNYGGASGQEIFNLSTEIRQAVHDQFGIWLEREVNII